MDVDMGSEPRGTADQGVGLDGRAVGHGPRRVLAEELLGVDREIIVVHRGQDYRLRVTSNDKLILTK